MSAFYKWKVTLITSFFDIQNLVESILCVCIPLLLFENRQYLSSKYYISALGVGRGSEGSAYFAYVKDQNSYSPENGF